MELRHLRYFMAAAEEESFGRASERLHVTRQAVSQIIADLEQELRTSLFERLAHRVRLTAAGRALLPRAQALMKQLDEAVALIRLVGQGKSGQLSIGYGSLTLMHSLFRDAIKQYREACPEVRLSLVEMPTGEQPRALADGRIDAGFMHFGPGYALSRDGSGSAGTSHDDTVLDWVHIQSGDLGVAVPSDHPLAQRSSVTIEDLVNEDFVVVPRSSSSPGYSPLQALFQRAGFEPRIVQEVATVSTQFNLISVGMGIGLTVTGPGFAYPSNLRVVPLEDVTEPATFVLGWIKHRMAPALVQMIEIINALAPDGTRTSTSR
jgi:DNA-binding transcriptional LysR family regulator